MTGTQRPVDAEGVVTGLKLQRRTAERVNLFVDGEFRCGAATDVVMVEGLRVGDRITAETLNRLFAADDRWKAKQAALSLLGARPRATGELAERLKRKGFAAESVQWAMSEVARLGFLDDAAFAESWVMDRLRLRPKGARALSAELLRKRIAPDVARAAIDRAMSAADVGEQDLCSVVADKWLRINSGDRSVRSSRGSVPSDPEAQRSRERRLTAYLARRGFPSAAIRYTVAATLGAAGNPRF